MLNILPELTLQLCGHWNSCYFVFLCTIIVGCSV